MPIISMKPYKWSNFLLGDLHKNLFGKFTEGEICEVLMAVTMNVILSSEM